MNQENNSPDASPGTPGDTGTDRATSPSPEKLIVPFEDPSQYFFTGFFQTVKLVLFQPTHFFRNYKLDGSIVKPLVFGLILGWAAAIIRFVCSRFVGSMFNKISERLPQIEGFDWEKMQQWSLAQGTLKTILQILLAPMIIALALFVATGFYHLFLMFVRGNRKKYEATFNVAAYGLATQVAEIIPFCGSIIAWVYGIVLTIIGLTEAHETDSWKAVFAVLVPVILCCFCFLILMVWGGTGFLLPILEKIPWD